MREVQWTEGTPRPTWAAQDREAQRLFEEPAEFRELEFAEK